MESEVRTFFNERRDEIQQYVDFLVGIDSAAQMGAIRFESTQFSLSSTQIRILYSSLYLQLYNLTEATTSRGLKQISASLVTGGVLPGELNEGLLQEWVRSVGRTHQDINPANRLVAAVDLCQKVLSGEPLDDFNLEAGGGGNWDDASMEQMWSRIGCSIRHSKAVAAAAKRPILDDLGALRVIRRHRNDLAHGSISFVECSESVSVGDLLVLSQAVFDYLDETVSGIDAFVANGFVPNLHTTAA